MKKGGVKRPHGDEHEEAQEQEEQEETMTMVDVLREQRALEEEARQRMLEGWGDESRCMYDSGYITQPVYACRTCSKQSGNMVGVCFACYLRCHLEHDTVELYHKHGFRCDCGTAASCCTCEFDTDQTPRCPCNSGNHYNHNFMGRFCWCDRPYDPIRNAKMVQCAACEDWFHDSCIKQRFSVVVPADEEFSSFFCDRCMCRLDDILRYYPQAFIRPGQGRHTAASAEAAAAPLEAPATCPRRQPVSKSDEDDKDDCCAPDNVALSRVGWHTCLCRCEACQTLYRTSFCPWVFEEDDDDEGEGEHDAPQPVEESESFAPTMLEQQAFDAVMKKPGSHTAKVEALLSVSRLSERLKEFISAKARASEHPGHIVITKEDIGTFFASLLEEKRNQPRDQHND